MKWETEDWELLIRAFSEGSPGSSYTLVQYSLSGKGTGSVPAELILAVRPLQLNPVWQRGGGSPIQSAVLSNAEAGTILKLNGEDAIGLAPAADEGWVSTLDLGEVAEAIQAGVYPDRVSVSDPDGRVSAGGVMEARGVAGLFAGGTGCSAASR